MNEIERLENVVDQAVMSFVVDMKYKLRRNNHKGHWAKMTLMDLLSKLKKEVEELEDEILLVNESEGTSRGALEASILECADVANFAMFMADIAKGLIKEIDNEPKGAGPDK